MRAARGAERCQPVPEPDKGWLQGVSVGGLLSNHTDLFNPSEAHGLGGWGAGKMELGHFSSAPQEEARSTQYGWERGLLPPWEPRTDFN